MTLPQLRDTLAKAWRKAKVQAPLVIEVAYLYILANKAAAAFIAGLLIGYSIA